MTLRKQARICTAVLALLFSKTLFASSQILEAENFCDIKKILSSLDNPKETLTVFDDDDTLSMMPCEDASHCQFIGTPAWFDWQNALPQNDPQRVAPDFPGLIKVSNDIIGFSKMTITGKDEMEVLQWMRINSFHMLVETARGPDLEAPTEKQLSALGILSLLDSTEKMQLNAKRPAELNQGIFYVSGQNKGEMLKALLAKTGQQYKTIILIDDSIKNIQDFAVAFQGDTVHVISIHYKQLQKSRYSLAR